MSTHLIKRIYSIDSSISPNGTLTYYWSKLKNRMYTLSGHKVTELYINDYGDVAVPILVGGRPGVIEKTNFNWVYKNNYIYYDSGTLTKVFKVKS